MIKQSVLVLICIGQVMCASCFADEGDPRAREEPWKETAILPVNWDQPTTLNLALDSTYVVRSVRFHKLGQEKILVTLDLEVNVSRVARDAFLELSLYAPEGVADMAVRKEHFGDIREKTRRIDWTVPVSWWALDEQVPTRNIKEFKLKFKQGIIHSTVVWGGVFQ